MIELVIGLAGVVIGGLISLATSLLVANKQYKNNIALEQKRWDEERERDSINDIKETLWHYFSRMEKYTSERRALILALSNPVLQPQTVFNNLFLEIWKMPSSADEASNIAYLFGYVQLSNDIKRLEEIFWELWSIKTKDHGNKFNNVLDEEARDIYLRLTSSIFELRAKISQVNIKETRRFELRDLPKLIDRIE
jgi:hypothetical protein